MEKKVTQETELEAMEYCVKGRWVSADRPVYKNTLEAEKALGGRRLTKDRRKKADRRSLKEDRRLKERNSR